MDVGKKGIKYDAGENCKKEIVLKCLKDAKKINSPRLQPMYAGGKKMDLKGFFWGGGVNDRNAQPLDCWRC